MFGGGDKIELDIPSLEALVINTNIKVSKVWRILVDNDNSYNLFLVALTFKIGMSLFCLMRGPSQAFLDTNTSTWNDHLLEDSRSAS